MSNFETGYKRLPGTGYRQLIPSWAMVLLFLVIGIFVLLLRGRRVQLWQGKDHLLIVEWTGSKEYYKRIQFGDIQWLTIHKTDDHIGISGIIATLALVFTVVAFLSPEMPMRITFLIFAFIGYALLAGNLYAGPTCKAFLGTAVQVEELVSLKRFKKARKVFDALRPSIVAAQPVADQQAQPTVDSAELSSPIPGTESADATPSAQ